MNLQQEILRDLSDEQKVVCRTRENTYLTACPGSGKTLTLTRRLAYLASLNPISRKWNIAITYTNRAADEITDRLDKMGINQSNIWIGTIHQFCMQFIIRPYSMYSKRLSKGYTIIDEYVQHEYGVEIAKELGIRLNYYDMPLTISEIKAVYLTRLQASKEIDFEQILQFSKGLVRSKDFISSNIASVLNSVLVDEFQDTNELQYDILAQIYRTNKEISLLFAGDVNQSIYGTLGGIAKSKAELEDLFNTSFAECSLTGCYRSTQKVIDFYKSFEVVKTGVTSVASIRNCPTKLSYEHELMKDNLPEIIAKIISSELSSGISPNEICVVAPQWGLLFSLTPDLKILLPEVSFDAPDISPIKYDPLNPYYLLSKLVFTESGQSVSIRKRVASELLATLRDDFKTPIPKGIDSYDILRVINLSVNPKEDGITLLQNSIKGVFGLLRIQLDHEKHLHDMYHLFFEKLQDRVKRYDIDIEYASISKFFKERTGIVLSTIHGIKGEEYTTVIAFALLNGYLPHWDFIMEDAMKPKRFNETQKLLYVLCSRAKKNIYLLSEKGRTTKKGNDYTPTDELIHGIIKFQEKQYVTN